MIATRPIAEELRAARDAAPVARRAARVTLVISALGDGGAERVVCRLASHWTRAQRTVSVVTLASAAVDVYALPAGVERVALDLVRPSRHPLEGARRSVARVVALRRAFATLRPDLVVSFTGHVNVLALLAAAGSGVPVLACERTDPRRERFGRTWSVLRRALYPRAAGVVVQTESVAGWARAFCPRAHVIPNFVERPPAFATPEAEGGPKRLVAMGRLAHEKGFDLLVDAFARVAPAHPAWSLTILGEGPERGALQRRLEALGLRGRVALPGRVSDTDAHLAAAHAFALPSRYEGFPNALLEAMACGLPAVAFDCPSGPADIVTHDVDGLLVPEGDVGAFSAALDRVLGSAAERARLGASARGIVDAFSPDEVLRRWSAVMDGVKA